MRPEWDAPAVVGAWMSTRSGGVSAPPYDTLNLGSGVGDDAAAVRENRALFAATLGAAPLYLKQVHGARVVRVGQADVGAAPPEADAACTTEPGIACTVLVADCMPVLLAAPEGRAVAAAHAGWRGLAAGVVDAALARLCELAACEPRDVVVWLGPCIGPRRFEVGADVLDAFGAERAGSPRFVPAPRADAAPRWLADLPGLARDQLAAAGVTRVAGGRWCTVDDASRFFSFRRDRVTGRHGAAVWIRR